MKIVHVCLCGPYNDYWGYQDNLIPKYNVLDGHDVTVITSVLTDSIKFVGYEKVTTGKYELRTGEKIIRLPFLLKNKMIEKLRYYKGLYESLEQEKPDFIFMHGLQFSDMNIVIKYKRNNPKCKLVVDSHATFDNSAQNILSKTILHGLIWRNKIRKSLSYFDKIFMIAPSCKKFAIKMYKIPEKKMEYLYLGADTEFIDFKNREKTKREIRNKLNIDKNDTVFITGGKLSRGKNIVNLINSFVAIEDNRLKLIIFGEFTNDYKEEVLEKINYDERIIFIGWIEVADVYDYYAASDVAIFPGTKSALWEQAICSGLPLIARKWDGMDYIDVGGNCLLLKDGSTKEISKAIQKVLNNAELREEMGEIARTKGYERFSYERISRQAINIE